MNTIANPITDALDAYRKRCGLDSLRFKAALIDMDGTLYDSMGNHVAAWSRIASDLGFDVDPDSFYLYEGMTGRQTITRLFNDFLQRDPTDDEIAKLYHRKTVYFSELPSVSPMPGANHLIEFLKDSGVTRILVTGSGQRSLIDRLRRDFPGGFDESHMITAANVTHGKPHPEPYLKAMELAGALPSESVVIENAPIGVEAGRRSGAFTIGLTTGPIPPKTMLDAGADLVLPSMNSLVENAHLIYR